jgi:hypothetical protein
MSTIDLFKALPEKKDTEVKQSNDLLCSTMEYEDNNFTEDATSLENFLDDQISHTLVDANSNQNINKSIVDFLRQYKLNQDNLIKDMSEVHVKKLVGKRS